jgi:hypothetical protein
MAVLAVVTAAVMVGASANAHVLDVVGLQAPVDVGVSSDGAAGGYSTVAGFGPILDRADLRASVGSGETTDQATLMETSANAQGYQLSAPIPEIASRTMMLLGLTGLAYARFSHVRYARKYLKLVI